MREYYGVAQSARYRVGCAGQTTYIFDQSGAEVAKRRDVSYAYAAAFRPDGGLLVVRSTTPWFAIYAPPDFRLVKKVRMRKPNRQPQDDGFCFSPDGTLFWSLEYQNDLTTHLVCYETERFSETARFFEGEKQVISIVEPVGGGYDLLGFRREGNGLDNTYWLTRFDGERIVSQTALSCGAYRYASRMKYAELCGFTTHVITMQGIDPPKHRPAALAELCLQAEKDESNA